MHPLQYKLKYLISQKQNVMGMYNYVTKLFILS